ncbi:hypothetical protein ACPCXF_13385 [Lysinibacillus agricola]
MIGVEAGRLLGAHQTPPGSFALRESEASAPNVLTVRKRSVSNKCFICAKVQRQQHPSTQLVRKSTTLYGDEPNNTQLIREIYYWIKRGGIVLATYKCE